MVRTMALSPDEKESIIRSTALLAELVCNVDNTKCPVSAAVKASEMVFWVTHLPHQNDVRVFNVTRRAVRKQKIAYVVQVRAG